MANKSGQVQRARPNLGKQGLSRFFMVLRQAEEHLLDGLVAVVFEKLRQQRHTVHPLLGSVQNRHMCIFEVVFCGYSFGCRNPVLILKDGQKKPHHFRVV